MLEPTPPEPDPVPEPFEAGPGDDPQAAEPTQAPAKGRGAGLTKGGRTGGVKGKKVKARTVYFPNALYERIWVAANRRNQTVSDYLTQLLDRQVPKLRVAGDEDAA
jgi:hypothetical protein